VINTVTTSETMLFARAAAALRSVKNSVISTTSVVLERHPVAANAIIYGGLYTAAEISQQKLRTNQRMASLSHLEVSRATPTHLDMSSVKRYAIMGTVVFPPILTKWYSWLDNRFPCTSRTVVMKKLVLDQFLLTPWLLAIFFIGMSFMEGERGESMLQEFKNKFAMTFTVDCLYWLPVQALNFLFVPPGFRILYIGLTTFLWLNVLCYIKSSPH